MNTLNELLHMEDWEEDFAYQRVRHLVQQRFGRPGLPGLDTLLFLIGVQELGRWRDDFTKEEKRDLMHVGLCRLMVYEGHYEFAGRDDEGWPHYALVSKASEKGLARQEALLKRNVVRYFEELETNEGRLD